MSTKIWRGDAPAVAQQTRITPGSVQIGDIFTLTINGKSISVTATAATAANVCTLMATAIAASTITEFSEFTVTNEGDTLLLTAATAGVPFVITAGTTDGSAFAVVVTTSTQGAAAGGATNMTQTWRIPLTAAGAFLVTLGGETANIPVGSDDATTQAYLEGLTAIGAGNVTVTKTDDANDAEYEAEFVSALAGVNVAEMQILLNSTKPLIRTTQEGAATGTPQNEKQTIGLGDDYSLGGSAGFTYTLTFSGQTTSALDANANAAAVQAALIALSNIDASGVSVTTLADGDTLQVEWVGTEGNAAQAQMTASIYSGSSSRNTTIDVTTVNAAGAGAAVNEVQVVTLTGGPTGGTFTLTYSGQTTGTIAYNASAATVDAALEALSNIGAGDVAVTGSAGGPWTVTFGGALAGTNVAQMTGSAASLTGAGSQTLSVSEVVASAGPNHWDTAANWISSGVPANGDDVRFEIGNVDCLYGLAQSGVTLASLHVAMSYSGKIGLPRVNEAGYIEYRTEALTIGATEILIGWGDGSGPGKVKLNTGAVQTAIEVRGSGGSSETGIPAVTWRGSHASNAVVVLDGDFGTSPYSDQSCVIDTLLQRGGTVSLKHTTLNDLLAAGQSITAYDCTLSGGPLEL